MFEIRDWAGNLMFGGERFSTFEDAWDYIYSEIEDEEIYQDLQVVECRKEK